MGLYPKPFLDRINTSVQHIVARVNPDYPERNASAAACGSGAPVPVAVVAANSGAKFLASTPCDANGKPLSSGTGADIPKPESR